MFEMDKDYTRTDIQEAVGGEIQTYLPQKEKIILAGCFNRELNPNCPHEIQAGNAGKVANKAALLISQPDTTFPVFIKETTNSKFYRFFGFYKCASGSSKPEDLAEAEQKSGRLGQLSYVLNLEAVT